MSQKRNFVLELKNGQNITLEFTSIDATGNRLWQMFATTEALDVVEQLVKPVDAIEPSATKESIPTKSVANAVKTAAPKKKK
jgi:hypothetical protein